MAAFDTVQVYIDLKRFEHRVSMGALHRAAQIRGLIANNCSDAWYSIS